jgi:predicted Zn-dependent peptidase
MIFASGNDAAYAPPERIPMSTIPPIKPIASVPPAPRAAAPVEAEAIVPEKKAAKTTAKPTRPEATRIHDEVLPNGVRIVVVPQEGAERMDIRVASLVGQDLEPAERRGMAHVVEHLMFEGTKTRSATKIDDEINQIGGRINAYTEDGQVVVFADVANKNAAKASKLLIDMYHNPRTDPKVVERERRITEQEMRMKVGDTPGTAWEVFQDLVFGKRGDARMPLGHADGWSPPTLTANDVKEWRDRYLTGQNTVVFVTGDPKKVPLTTIRAAAAKIPTGWKADEPRPQGPVPGRSLTMLSDPTNVNVELAMVLPTAQRFNRAAAAVARGILNDQLFDRMRVKHPLTYGASATPSEANGLAVDVELLPRDVKQGTEILTRAVRRLPDSITPEKVAVVKKRLADMISDMPDDPVEDAFGQALDRSKKIAPVPTMDILRSQLRSISTEDVIEAAKQMGDFKHAKFLAVGPVDEGTAKDIQSGLNAARIPKGDMKISTFNRDAWLAALQPTWHHDEKDHHG